MVTRNLAGYNRAQIFMKGGIEVKPSLLMWPARRQFGKPV